MGVAAQPFALVADYHGQLAVGLEAHHAVNDVDSGPFQQSGPGDVGLFVEPRLNLHDRQHLLASLGGIDEGVNDGGVAGSAVQGLFDGQHLGVLSSLLDEPLHAGGEGVVGVMDEHVATTDRGKHVGWASRLHLGQVRMRDGQEVRVGQIVAVDVGQREQAGQVQWGRQPEDLLVSDVKFTGE